MVKTINIQMDDKEFFDLVKIKKKISRGEPTLSWREFLLLIANKKS